MAREAKLAALTVVADLVRAPLGCTAGRERCPGPNPSPRRRARTAKPFLVDVTDLFGSSAFWTCRFRISFGVLGLRLDRLLTHTRLPMRTLLL